jgi:hypothetical protein
MPGYDGKGPDGTGPIGRGLGPCGDGTPRFGRGFFGFRAGRRGGRRGFWWPQQGVSDKDSLKSEKRWLEQQLNAVNTRLNDQDEG